MTTSDPNTNSCYVNVSECDTRLGSESDCDMVDSSEEETQPKDMNSKTIPEEVLFIILTMVPVKSLLRFKCVSKHWFSIISDPYFVAAHLSRSKSRPKLLISVTRGSFSYSPDDELSFYSIEYPEEDQTSSLHATAHGSIKCSYGQLISRSASGIICCNCNQGIRIGNPITGEFNLIHEYPKKNEFVRSYLGLDPIDETKVVLRLVNPLSGQEIYSGRNSRLFSVIESQWHDTAPFPEPLADAAEYAICMNGVIYFTATLWSEAHRYLYAYDVRLESFEMIRCPPNVMLWFGFEITELVIEYKGRVALVGYEDGEIANEMNLWILEDPRKHSWSFKSFVIPWTDYFSRLTSKLLGATHKGELIFATGRLLGEGYINLYLFEIDTNTLRKFQVDGFVPNGPTSAPTRLVQLCFLIESLESLK